MVVAGLVLVLVRPSLLLPLVLGVVLGGIVAAVKVARDRPARRVRARDIERRDRLAHARARRPWVGVLLTIVVVLVVVSTTTILLGGDSDDFSPGGGGGQIDLGPVVRGVDYRATLRFDDERDVWRRRGLVRVPRSLVTEEAGPNAVAMLADRRSLARLLPGWRYLGVRGEKRDIYAYTRADTVPVRTRFWPLTDNQVEIESIKSPALAAELVPRDNSVVVLRTPKRLVYDTDPSGARRKFGSTDIVTLKLAGLEDDPDLRQVQVQVANRFGRTWLFEGLRTVTGWGIMKWLVLGIAGAGVAFFVPYFLKRRFPDPPGGAAPAPA